MQIMLRRCAMASDSDGGRMTHRGGLVTVAYIWAGADPPMGGRLGGARVTSFTLSATSLSRALDFALIELKTLSLDPAIG